MFRQQWYAAPHVRAGADEIMAAGRALGRAGLLQDQHHIRVTEHGIVLDMDRLDPDGAEASAQGPLSLLVK
eukprot:1140558-Alexandrium_andersonii.AAC.1